MKDDEKNFINEINPSSEEIANILNRIEKIAIVGLSPKEDRPSNRVAKYLLDQRYQVIPVNPGQKEILGFKCYRSLKDIPFEVDAADLFIRADRVPDVVDQALDKGIKLIWMQLGIYHRESGEKAIRAGASVVMDKCIKIEHERMTSSIP
ncbi:CoA-binding protein [Thermodesulfobacteriota bacterium]